MTDIAKINIKLQAENEGLLKKLNASEKRVGRFAKKAKTATKKANMSFKNVGAPLLSLKAKLGIASAAMGVLAKKTLDNVDAMGKFADQIGVAPEKLQAIQHAAQMAGMGVDTTNMALQRMQRRVSEAANGTGEAVNALQELNIDAAKLAQLPVDQQLKKVADAMQGVEGQGDKTRLAMKLFDSEGVKMIRIMGEGSAAINAAEKELALLGATVDSSTTKQFAETNDAFTRFSTAVSGIGTVIMKKFAPALENIFNGLAVKLPQAFRHASQVIGDFLIAAQPTFDVIGRIIGVTIGGFQMMGSAIIKAVGLIVGGLSTMTAPLNGAAEMVNKFTNQIRTALGMEEVQFNPFNQEGMEEKAAEMAAKAAALMLQADQTIKDAQAGTVFEGGQSMITRLFSPDSDTSGGEGGGEGGEGGEGEDPVVTAVASKFDMLRELSAGYYTDAQAMADDGYKALQSIEKADLKFSELNAKQKMGVLKSLGGSALSLLQSSGKKGFKIAKKINLARAIVSTATGVAEALKLGWPVGVAKAAVIAAKGMKTIKQIKGTSIGSKSAPSVGGGGGGGSVSAASVPTLSAQTETDAVQAAPRVVNVTVNDSIDPSGARRIIEAINEAVDDGLEINAMVTS